MLMHICFADYLFSLLFFPFVKENPLLCTLLKLIALMNSQLYLALFPNIIEKFIAFVCGVLANCKPTKRLVLTHD